MDDDEGDNVHPPREEMLRRRRRRREVADRDFRLGAEPIAGDEYKGKLASA